MIAFNGMVEASKRSHVYAARLRMFYGSKKGGNSMIPYLRRVSPIFDGSARKRTHIVRGFVPHPFIC